MPRAHEVIAEGGAVEFPPMRSAGWLAECLQGVGLCGRGASGIQPLAASELRAWADGTGTELGCYDFQQLLDASREYVSAYHEYADKMVDAPWQPDMTEEELAAIMKAQERYFDMVMGA